MTGQADDFAKLAVGDHAPWFKARMFGGESFAFHSVGGRWVAIAFLGSLSQPASRAALDRLAAAGPLFDDQRLPLFCVSLDPADEARAGPPWPGWRWFLDDDFAISRLYGAAPASAVRGGQFAFRPMIVLLDPQMRVHWTTGLAQLDQAIGELAALPDPADHAGIELHAPILIVPRVVEPQLCERLIAHYDEGERIDSGVMRQQGDKTVSVLDHSFKRRSDSPISDQAMIDGLCARIRRRVAEPLRRAFQFDATRIERHIVVCYDGETGGHFHAHRDNTTPGTAHRRFAVSINLNAEFEGGELVFPEYGPRGYKPPPGAALIFGCGLLHRVTPMVAGRRFVYVPFLYDEAAATVRQENRASVVTRG